MIALIIIGVYFGVAALIYFIIGADLKSADPFTKFLSFVAFLIAASWPISFPFLIYQSLKNKRK